MAKILNLTVWKKAYMLEFIAGEKTDIFTFAVPPKSENIKIGQRINETKTYGGSIFDDYGNDTYKINLSGTTINNEKKIIYRGNKKLPDYYTGEQEILELRKLIKKYGEFDNLKDKKVYLYDLSKTPLLALAAGIPTENSYWRVMINNLDVKRDTSNPFAYQYTLEMTAFDEAKGNGTALFQGLADNFSKIQEGINKIQEVAAVFDKVQAAASIVNTGLVQTKNLLEQLNNGNLTGNEKIALATSILGGGERLVLGTNLTQSAYDMTKELMLGIDTFDYICDQDATFFGNEEKSGSISENEVYKITFYANGGYFDDEKETAEAEVEYSKYALPPDEPKRENYGFLYWYENDENEAFDFENTPIKNHLLLKAKWKQEKVIVSFNTRGGSEIADVVVVIGETVNKPENPTREGFSFVQWCTNYAATIPFVFSTPLTADTVLYAAWEEVNTVTVTFNSNGGSDVEAQTVEIGEKIIYPLTPTKEDYIFGGWYSDNHFETEFDFSSAVVSDITLYAKWTHITCNVSFDTNGGSFIASQKITIGNKAIEPTEPPTKDGFTFEYWCSDSGATNRFNFNMLILADITLFARWLLNVYTVSFFSNGGSYVASQRVSHGQKALFPTLPTKEGYSFLKWCSDKELTTEFDFSSAVVSDVTLYAQYFGSEYTVTFNTNGGGSVEAQTVKNGNKAIEPKTPEKDGFTFGGWYADEALTKSFDFDTAIMHDTILYAKWAEA